MDRIDSIGHSVFFEPNFESLRVLLDERKYSKVFILTDRNTGELCLPLLIAAMPESFTYDIIEVDPGEENKNIDFCIGIWKMLLDFDADRNAVMINLGGGVVTDMGGFAASTFKRGIDFIQMPTTLLAQVDASVGGKTGIDLDAVKNVIGTFTLPQAVFINVDFLRTLDQRQLVSGYAEMVKHAFIYDSPYYEQLRSFDFEAPSVALIYRSVQIKNEVVKADPKEAGLRKILNFGHTIGHAIETCSLDNDANPLLHGEAIAVGMICEAFLSYRHNGLSEAELNEITGHLRSVFPTYTLKAENFDAIIATMRNDKKNSQGRIGFSLLKQLGECSYNHYLEAAEIEEALTYYQSL
jgi:3-dehydroquinate synthase